MDRNTEILIEEYVPLEGQHFVYYPGMYAMHRLAWAMPGEEATVAQLKQTSAARFLNVPVVRQYIKACNGRPLRKAQMLAYRPEDALHFTLGRSFWGTHGNTYEPYYQNSRAGRTLVLQLNFGCEHHQLYKQLLRPCKKLKHKDHPFVCGHHPVKLKSQFTLAWARIDVDYNTNEMLVEEVQSDWVKRVEGYVANLRRSRRARGAKSPYDGWHTDFESCEHDLRAYHSLLAPYAKVWAEATLHAAVVLGLQHLDAHTLYYHTYELGSKLKHAGKPPRSLYTKLPRQYGFELTSQPPNMLAGIRRYKTISREMEHPAWFRINLKEQIPGGNPVGDFCFLGLVSSICYRKKVSHIFIASSPASRLQANGFT